MEQVTKHAKKRLRERISVSKRQVELAIKRGNNVNDYTGSFRRYLDKIKYKDVNFHIKIYGNHIYIFNPYWYLVTALTISSKYSKYKVKEVK